MLWNCTDLLRFRFRLLKSFGSGFSFVSTNRNWSETKFSTVDNFFTKFVFTLRSSIISQKVGLSFLIYFYVCVSFYVGSGFNSGSGIGMHTGSAYLKLRSGSITQPLYTDTAPVPGLRWVSGPASDLLFLCRARSGRRAFALFCLTRHSRTRRSAWTGSWGTTSGSGSETSLPFRWDSIGVMVCISFC